MPGDGPRDRPLAATNRQVRWLARLIRDPRARRDEGVLVVDGPRALATFTEAGGELTAIFADDPARSDLAGVVARAPGAVVHHVARSTLDRIADASGPQGLVGVGRWRAADLAAVVSHRRVVVLDAVADPGNVGAIVRVAAAVGAAVVCGEGCADPRSPRAVRSSAGTVAAVDVVSDVAVAAALDALRSAGHRLVGTAADGEPFADLDAGGFITVVLGSEGAGLGTAARERIELTLAVPMRPPVESLNVAVTAGVVLYGLLPPGT